MSANICETQEELKQAIEASEARNGIGNPEAIRLFGALLRARRAECGIELNGKRPRLNASAQGRGIVAPPPPERTHNLMVVTFVLSLRTKQI